MSELQGLLALQGSPPDVTPSEAAEVARRLYGIDAPAEPLAGERDRNFRLSTAHGPCVLKFIDGAASESVVAGQSAVLRHLATRCKLGLPRLLPTAGGSDLGVARTPSGRWRVRLVSYLRGELLLNVRPSRALLRDVGRQIGALDQALQYFTHPALGQQIAWDIRQLPQLSALLPRIADPDSRELLTAALQPALALLPRLAGLRSQAIHGDCHPGNVLVSTATERCTGIIDFGDLIHGPLILEIAVTVAESLATGVALEDDCAELVSGFSHAQRVTCAEGDLLYDMLLARLCVMELIPAWRAAREGRPGVPGSASQQLERLLSQGRTCWTRRFTDAIRLAAATA